MIFFHFVDFFNLRNPHQGRDEHMGTMLFAHNQTAYESAITLMEEKGKAAVIHPTGTGKSYIAFQLALDHPDARICWLAPSEYIFRTQIENLQKDGNDSINNITFLTYSRLRANEHRIQELCPDYIILDEFHRCGAPEWGKSVERLLKEYPHAKILGLSATNIRDLDNRRDMAQDIFEGNIASEMTLGEAIAREILPAPRYVISLFSYGKASYEKELARLEEKISMSTLSDEKESAENIKLLEKLRRALEQANGLEQVFQRNMTEKQGRYLVFCADKDHMEKMKEYVHEWFHLIDEEPHIYTACYDDPETARSFDTFREDKSRHLKLLYCIDMLNEGIHVEDVDGVILLRPTVSPVIYLQQIGRALSVGSHKQPVIFDLVNNFDSLCCIDYLEKEIKEAFAGNPSMADNLFSSTRGEKSGFPEKFRIIDETRDCRILFEQLQRRLSSVWDSYYKKAEDYYHRNGNLKVPKTYVTETGLSLGNWIRTQRKVYQGKIPGNLSEEQILRLNLIGMDWNPRENAWKTGFDELKAYYEKHGNVDVKARYVSESGYPLGKWVSNLRRKINSGDLEEEQLAMLEEIGMVRDKAKQTWDCYISAAQEYYREHGNLKVPVKYRSKEGVPLGRWISNLRNGFSGDKKRCETLSEEQIRQLNLLGMEWEKESTVQWEKKYRLAEDYYNQHGNLKIPAAYCVEGVKLGRWLSGIRSRRKNPRASGTVLNEKRIRQLDSIGMDWDN